MSEPLDFIYAVARIRCKELELLTKQDIEQLMACTAYDDCLKVLADKGWGNSDEASAEALLSYEAEKTWLLIRELTPDLTPFDVLIFPIDYNNLKAVIKAAITGVTPHNAYLGGGSVSPETMWKAIEEKNFKRLPETMQQAAETAYQTFLQTEDGQLCDAILDHACLAGILNRGTNNNNDILQHYAELTVAISNIKIAVRCCKTRKNSTFIHTALVPCKTLDTSRLQIAAGKSLDEVYTYLMHTPYAAAVDALKTSYSAFEKWCDDKVMTLVKEQKTNPFTIGPLFAYVIARQNEIATVRIILSGKLNDIDDTIIKERLRDMYV